MTENISILYIEDIFENRILIKRVLNAEGYSVTFAENGNEALAKIEQSKYDLILMDINLPDIDGYKLTSILRQNPKFQDTLRHRL